MGATEITIFLVFMTFILLVFISGVVLFIIQYRKRKVLHENEKLILNEVHHREMLQAQNQIQAQTMKDIGREIHDNVGQRLTLAIIYTNQLLKRSDTSNVAEQIAAIGTIVHGSLEELRSLSKSLVNNDADASELVAMLREECKKVAALGICKVNYQIPDLQFGLPVTVKNFVVRIAQEALQNSLKHAFCQSIELHLDFSESFGLTLTVSDDGRGFDVNAAASGIGLQNMKQRAELIGGTFSLKSRPSAGTIAKLFVPVDKLQPG